MASFGGQAMPSTAPRHGHSHGHGQSYGGGQSRPGGASSHAGMAPAAGVPVAMPAATASAAPAGTFTSGTKIQVGSHRVVIQKYLSEGGFAHVYLVKLPQPVSGTDLAVLKRVAVPDKEALRGMRTEVETMKRLKGHRAIVTYIDSHASELRGGGYEVFLLMEYCDGGGLIDFMNTRLQHRLTEPEILNIFTDVAEGVACMHYLKPPLLHRDLKVENVLITTYGSTRKFKLCDFGSAAPPRPAPTTVVECRLMDEDVQKHTTLQYRSPEMIDVYRKQPIDEKSDIWALGVLLYKLCYYTTPFEDQGQLAILNASFKYPSYPVFSDRLKRLIASMLKENLQSRPNIYEVLREGCAMQGREPPIKDIYSGRPRAEPRGGSGSAQAAAASEKSTPAPVVGASFAPSSMKQQQAIPDVVPMRRGRPQSTAAAASPAKPQPPPSQHSRPSPSPMRVTNGDPFAALDSRFNALGLDSDELSSRFPTLDQFSLLHDHGTKFDFDEPAPEAARSKDLGQKVAERLADEVFASPSKPPQQFPESDSTKAKTQAIVSPPLNSASAPPRATTGVSRASAIIAATPELQALASPELQIYQPSPKPSSKPVMVSTGTMTTTPPPEKHQIYRFPPVADQHRSASVPRVHEASTAGGRSMQETQGSSIQRVPSFSSSSRPSHIRHASSSRPSLEGGRPSVDLLDSTSRPVHGNSLQPRPVSTHLESNLDYLREKERPSPNPNARLSPGLPSSKNAERVPSPGPDLLSGETNIESNVDFLRSIEDSDSRKRDSGSKGGGSHSHRHGKRSSLGSLSGTKNILAGKFGDAFKRFESNNNSSSSNNSSGSGGGPPPPPRTPSPLKHLARRDLTPITGSEATDGRSDDGEVLEETDDMTPEMRREIERRRLSMEEKRVAAAGAEYRKRVAQRGGGNESSTTSGAGGGTGAGATPLPKSIGGVSRAVSIQNKVQSLLDESNKSSNVARTASGYGHFTDSGAALSAPSGGGGGGGGEVLDRPEIPRKPVGATARIMSMPPPRHQPQGGSGLGGGGGMTAVVASPPDNMSAIPAGPGAGAGAVQQLQQQQRPPPPPVGNKPDVVPSSSLSSSMSMPISGSVSGAGSSAAAAAATTATIRPLAPSASGRPMAPPKPTHLNRNLTSGGRPASPTKPVANLNLNKPLPPRGVTGGSPQSQQQQLIAPGLPGQPGLDMSPQEKDDYLRDFAKRFPSLTSIEMVERDLGAEAAASGGDGRSGVGGGR